MFNVYNWNKCHRFTLRQWIGLSSLGHFLGSQSRDWVEMVVKSKVCYRQRMRHRATHCMFCTAFALPLHCPVCESHPRTSILCWCTASNWITSKWPSGITQAIEKNVMQLRCKIYQGRSCVYWLGCPLFISLIWLLRHLIQLIHSVSSRKCSGRDLEAQ